MNASIYFLSTLFYVIWHYLYYNYNILYIYILLWGMDITIHKEYTNQLEDINKKYIGSILWTWLKYKESLDEVWNIINNISNSFFNIDTNGKEKTEADIKEMNILQESDIQARNDATEIAKKAIIIIQEDIEKNKNILPSIQSLLLKMIQQTLKKITIIELATPLEAMKYSYVIDTKVPTITKNKDNKKQLWYLKKWYKNNIKRIEQIQEDIYGPRVSDVTEEKNLIINNLSSLLKNNKDKITEEEAVVFSKFLNKFPVDSQNEDSIKIKKNHMKGNIPTTSVKNIANYTINSFYDIPWWETVTNIGKNNLSVSIDKQKLQLPGDKNSFTESSLSTIIEHEIWGHVVRWTKSKNRLWFAAENYENIEEWITKFNEYIIHYDRLEDIPINPEISHISTFIWENYTFKDTFQLLQIYYKLIGETDIDAHKLAISRTKRVKSYYDWDQPWANRKDVIYYRGIKRLIEYLKTLSPEERADFYNDAYFAKLSFEDIALIPELRKELHVSTSKSDIPFPLWKLILRKQSYVNPKTWNTTWAFLWEENIKERLIGEDFRFLKLKPLTTEKKRQVINIIEYKEESKKYNNLKKDLEYINTLLKTWQNISNPEDFFISEITRKIFIKRKNMERKEITDKNTLERWDKTRWFFNIHQILQKVGNEIEWILTKQLK